MEIKFQKAAKLKEKPDAHDLGFGKYVTDYMFVMDYDKENGWHDARIVPYDEFMLDPRCVTLHYGSETFEGLKAYRTDDGRILLFRPEANAVRMQNSNDRLCLAKVPTDMFVEAVRELVKVEQDWVPDQPETSLYIRPVCYATENTIGVHPADSFRFFIILSPVGCYYPEGVNPVKIFVEDEYVREVIGGTGACKCGGNYAASVKAQEKAEKLGYTQVLWLDGVHREYVEEVGTMNVMFKIDGKIVTPPLEGSVLPGITRDSIIRILKDWGYEVEERRLSIHELMQAARDGKLEEAWGTGTAAVVSPIGELNYKGELTTISDFKTGELTQKLYHYLTGIQWGKVADPYGWTQEI